MLPGTSERVPLLFAVPVIVTAFLLQHAVQGWCPPVPILRRLGYRTNREQDDERIALKFLRGDFDPLLAAGERSAAQTLGAVQV